MTYNISPQSQVDSNNSTTSTLSGSAVFTGTKTTVSGQICVLVTIVSNADSAAGGLVIQFSDDSGTTWKTHYQDTYFTNTIFYKKYHIIKNTFRVVYTNGSSAQSSFTLSSYLCPTDVQPHEMEFSDTHVDEFNRLRTVEPFTLLDARISTTGISNNDLLLVNKSSGTTGTTVANSSIAITASGTSAYYKSQTRKYCVYQAGKSLSVLASGIINNASNTSGCTTRIGYFDDNDGLFFSYDATNGIAVNVRNSRSGQGDTQILKSSWNGDKMDGTGQSGINLNYAKEILFTISFAWLGVGIIRFGCVVMGKKYYAHTVVNYNTLTFPYMNNPNLPIRYEISTSGSGDSGGILQGCASVASWGGYNPIGRTFTANNGTGGVSCTTSETVILAITGNSNYSHQNIIPTVLNAFNSGTATVLMNLRLYLAGNSPTSGTTTWTNVDATYSVVKYASGTTAILNGGTFATTGSVIVYSDYIYGKTATAFRELSQIFDTVSQITSNIDNTADILVLTGTATTATQTMYTSLCWQEVY